MSIGNGKTPPTDDAERPRISVEWDDTGAMHLVVEGRINQDHLVMAAFYLTRTADDIVDQLRAAAPPIVRAGAIPQDIGDIRRKDRHG